MEKIIIDENLKGAELISFLRANKAQLIRQKKSVMKFTDAISFSPITFTEERRTSFKSASGNNSPAVDGVVRVKVVANTSMLMDSQSDVLLKDSAAKSMKERKGLIPHLKNHGRTLDDQVGDVKDIYYENIPLKELGLNKAGTAQALVFETDIKKSYDQSTFTKYSNGLIKQHSIGLSYVKLELAVNDEEDEKEMDFFNKYINDIINKEEALEQGYFWVVPEFKLIENSAVLFGSNYLTPTLQTGNSTQAEPPVGTLSEPQSTYKFDLNKAIEETIFFKN